MDPSTSRARSRSKEFWLIGASAILLLLFGLLSYTTALTKSATFDEPLHLVGGCLHWGAKDFRINPEDPALFGYFASILEWGHPLKVDYESPQWPLLLQDFNKYQWAFVMSTLFQTPQNDGDPIIQRARFLFVVVGMLLGIAILWWAWRLGGAVPALVATALYALDPNFLGHAALVKNDVPISLLILLVVISTWSFGKRGTWLSLVGIAVGCALAVNIKFSGLLLGPIVLSMLMARALLPQPWDVARWRLDTRLRRLFVVPVVCSIVAFVCVGAIWACYGLRFGPTPDPQATFNIRGTAIYAKKWYLDAHHVEFSPENDESILKHPVTIVDSILWAESNRLLPQTWLQGLLHTYATTLNRHAYLLGMRSYTGWWYYFPCAVLFKTPLGTLLVCAVAAAGAVALGVGGLRNSPTSIDWWKVICFALPLALYGYNALTTNMNAGIRHILPMYPLIFVATGAVVGSILRMKMPPRLEIAPSIGMGLVLLGLATETLAAYPEYIAFFNAPSNISRDGYLGGYYLLGDSNLDWGQDLKLLAKWQKKHMMRRIFLSYFGIADPQYYGVTASHIVGGWPFMKKPEAPSPGEECYLVVSATNLQGIFYGDPKIDMQYVPLRYAVPDERIGSSLYVYEIPRPPEETARIRAKMNAAKAVQAPEGK